MLPTPLAVDVSFFDRFLGADLAAFEWVQKLQEMGIGSFLTPVLKVITTLGEAGIIFILLALALGISKKYKKAGVAIVVALLVMEVLNNLIIKDFFSRPRPFNLFDDQKLGIIRDTPLYRDWYIRYQFPEIVSRPSSWSFPSGHSSSAFAAAVACAFGSKKAKFGIPVFILAFVMAFSRVYVEVHYLSDVVAGAIVGIIYGFIGCVIVNIIWKKFGDKIDAFVEGIKAKIFRKGKVEKTEE